jgi:glucosamine 6-phosphate synthetase-like amidotransferase/phosphosugar isomerase protein
MSKGDHKHYMEKKKFNEQPEAVMNTINGRIGGDDVLDNIFGLGSSDLFAKVQRIQYSSLVEPVFMQEELLQTGFQQLPIFLVR